MIGKKVLPKSLKKQLLQLHITKEDILYTATTDMNASCQFAKGYLLLTRDTLIAAQALPDKNDVFAFRGTRLYADNSGLSECHYEIITYPMKDITHLEYSANICTGSLYAMGETEKQIALFSNNKLQEILKLIRYFSLIKEGKELSDKEQDSMESEEYCPVCGTMYTDKERKICPKCMNKKSIILRTLAYFKPFIPQLVIVFICFLAAAGLNLVWPILNGNILYDKILAKNTGFLESFSLFKGRFTTALFFVVLTMLLTKLVLQLFSTLQTVITAHVVPKVVQQMKSEIFETMGKLSISFYTSRQTGSLMTRVLSDAERVTGFFVDILPFIFVHGFTLISTCIIMFCLNWKMALAALCLFPILFYMSCFLMPRLFHLFGKRHRAERGLNAQVSDNITGARVIKAFGQEQKEIERFSSYNRAVRDAEISIVGFDNRYHAIYTFVQNVSSLAVWAVGSCLVLSRTNIELGLLISFSSYVTQLNEPLNFISRAFRSFSDSLNSAQRMFEIIDAVPEITERPHPAPVKEIQGNIEIKNLTFGYEPHFPVLHDISFTVEAGNMLGIVGRSGAGKSTLVNLISRLYDPQEGAIYIDGINVRDLPFSVLRKNVAMVSQETYIFMGSVAENIAYAKKDATREEIIHAAYLASAHDFICQMPDGYDTLIGSGGRSLSGGERQRISIARAILADPKILILDEATASVDTETEKAIQNSLNYLTKNRTTLSIAHRLSTLRDADSLIVLDHGTITESGTHQELIEKHGTFYKLMELQTKALAMKGIE